MSHGATLDHEDVDGDTPYTLAFNKGHRNLVMMIEGKSLQDQGRSAVSVWRNVMLTVAESQAMPVQALTTH